MPGVDQHAGPTASLIADCRVMRKKLATTPLASPGDCNTFLKNEVVPMFIAVLEQIMEVDDVIQEVVEQQESYIHPELTAQIFSTIAVGGTMAALIEDAFPDLDDLKKKKLSDAIAAWKKSAELTVMAVDEATTLESDEDSDEESDEEIEETEEPSEAIVPDSDTKDVL